MKILKNLTVGFIVSFLGSLPLGYINFIAFDVFRELGSNGLYLFLLGVIFVEAFIIYFTLTFVKRLSKKFKLIKVIDFLAVFFLLIVAYSFYAHGNNDYKSDGTIEKYAGYPAFVMGIFFNAVNFIQIPFWTGWNLYLVNNDFVDPAKNLRVYYVVGTLSGSFAGISAIVYLLNYLTTASNYIAEHLLSHFVPILFIIFAIAQAFRFWKKYVAKKTVETTI